MQNTAKTLTAVALLSGSMITGICRAQLGWTTSQGDAQRSAWVRSDGYISVENLRQQRFGLEWKRKLENAPRQLNSLSAGVSVSDTGWNITPANIGGSSNNVYGIEMDTGGVVWSRHFDAPLGEGTLRCPGGMTANVARPTAATEIVTGSAGPFRGRGRIGPQTAGGGVGQPGEGVPMELMQNPRLGGGAAPAAAGRGGSGGRGAAPAPTSGDSRSPIPQSLFAQELYAVTSDGLLHTLGQFLGKDVKKPVPFLPANANVADLVSMNGTIYATTINGCGGAPNGLWAMEISVDTRPVTSWKNAANPVGGPAFDSHGTLFLTVAQGSAAGGGYSNAVVALDPKTLQVKDSFTAPNASFISSPVIFPYQGRELLAAEAKDGRVFLLDTASLGGADRKTPLFVSAAGNVRTTSRTALATWEDAARNRWLLVPISAAKGSVAAFQVTGDAAKPVLQQQWVSRDLVSPAGPIVVNGVAFVLSTGEYIPPTANAKLAERVSKSVPAVLYALNAASGKELWNSRKDITSFVHSAALWSVDGQVYVGTYDGTLYAFGFAMDRHV